MFSSQKQLNSKLLISLLLILILATAAACSSSSSDSEAEHETDSGEMEEMEHEEGDEHSEEEHEDEHTDEHTDEERVANNGATIAIISPDSGTSFGTGEEVTVEIEVEQFALGEDGNHWHIYVDGTSWGMVVGDRTTETLRGLDSGSHKIEVYLTGGDHIELQDGDTIDVTVE